MADKDEWLDELLRSKRVQSVVDDGFTDRLLMRLPPRKVALRWPVPVLSVLGMLLAGFALRHNSDWAVVQVLIHPHGVIAASLVATGIVWLSCAWAVWYLRLDPI